MMRSTDGRLWYPAVRALLSRSFFPHAHNFETLSVLLLLAATSSCFTSSTFFLDFYNTTARLDYLLSHFIPYRQHVPLISWLHFYTGHLPPLYHKTVKTLSTHLPNSDYVELWTKGVNNCIFRLLRRQQVNWWEPSNFPKKISANLTSV